MKINWKLRFKNKTTLLALATCLCTFIYQVLSIIGITAPISEDMVLQFAGAALNILVGIGVIVDPTTHGTGDSGQALTYKEPR